MGHDYYPLTYDEMVPAEWAMVVVVGVIYAVDVVALAILYWNRSYRPIKATQVHMLMIVGLAAVLFSVAMLPALRFLPAEGAFAVCNLWSPWLYNTFGLSLVGSVIVYRFSRLFWILKRRRSVTGWRFKLLLPCLWLPSVIISIAHNSRNASGPLYETAPSTGQLAAVCIMEVPFSMAYIGYTAVLAFIFGALAISLRNVRHRIFNEYGRTLVFVFAVISSTILYVVFIQLKIFYYVWGRWLVGGLMQVSFNWYLWSIMGRPLLGFLFNREEHLEEFNSYIRGKVNSSTLQDPSSSNASAPVGGPRDSSVGVLKNEDSVEMGGIGRTDSDLLDT